MRAITDLILANSFSPYKGGISRYLRGISDELSQKTKLAVITRIDSNDKSVEGYDVIRSIAYGKSAFLNKFVHYWLCIAVFLANVDSIKRVYAGAAVPYGILCLFFKLMKPSVSVYVFAYGSELLWSGKRFHAEIRNFILRKADIIITISNYSKTVLKHITEKPIIMAAPGYTGEIRPRHHDKKRTIRLLTVASLNRRKGQHLVIEALNNIKHKLDFQYVIIGNGPRKRELIELIEKYNLRDSISVQCGLSDSEVQHHYASSDIFIMPTYRDDYDIEGFGIVYLEAGAHCLPIIAAPVGGVVDIVKDGKNGIMVRERNISDIENAIMKLSKDEQLREIMGKNAMRTAASFTYIDAVKRITDTF